MRSRPWRNRSMRRRPRSRWGRRWSSWRSRRGYGRKGRTRCRSCIMSSCRSWRDRQWMLWVILWGVSLRRWECLCLECNNRIQCSMVGCHLVAWTRCKMGLTSILIQHSYRTTLTLLCNINNKINKWAFQTNHCPTNLQHPNGPNLKTPNSTNCTLYKTNQ